jgi:hypothetical protein
MDAEQGMLFLRFGFTAIFLWYAGRFLQRLIRYLGSGVATLIWWSPFDGLFGPARETQADRSQRPILYWFTIGYYCFQTLLCLGTAYLCLTAK